MSKPKTNLQIQKEIFRSLEESRMKEGLGEKKYKEYELLAREKRFDEIPEFQMHRDYYNPFDKKGYHYAENLLNPRNYFRARYDSTFFFFERNKN